MGKLFELIKKDRIVQVMLGVAGLLFFVALFKKETPPPQEQVNQKQEVQQVQQTKPVEGPEQFAKPSTSAFEVPFTQEQTETEVEKLKKLEQNAQPLTQNKAEEQKAEQKEEDERTEKKKEVVKAKAKEKRTARKAERKPSEEKRERILKGYAIVCVVGGSCALYDAETGQSYREGSEIKGWVIERLSPQGAVLRKGNIKVREDF